MYVICYILEYGMSRNIAFCRVSRKKLIKQYFMTGKELIKQNEVGLIDALAAKRDVYH
jgi:hypothetical protein